jgi:4-hydroxy-tetrahydrodipicolinate synthase
MHTGFGTIITAMVTPFDGELAVDHERLAELATWLVDHGSDGLVVAGTTGESPTLTDTEKLAMFRTVVATVGERVPVIAGTGTYDTRHTTALTQAAAECGADAALVVTPYYKSRRSGVLSSTSGRWPRPARCRSSSTTSRAAPG